MRELQVSEWFKSDNSVLLALHAVQVGHSRQVVRHLLAHRNSYRFAKIIATNSFHLMDGGETMVAVNDLADKK